ncbi:protein yellow [Aplysia californica]|uniref:Protein yellow n=1 Tax=Aplysia californica TaxID=6500 RepID=A0ABM0JCL7_APLCA|nr:protein yellow [Aplysia californica]
MNWTGQLLSLVCLALAYTKVDSRPRLDALMVHEWTSVDIEWPSDAVKQEYIKNGSFVAEKNIITGIKVYKNQIYVTIPRWRTLTGIPVTLATVVQSDVRSKLRPYPDWTSQTVGDCQSLQNVQSMEIDPNSGLMYVLDTGRIGILSDAVKPENLCPAKIVVLDLNTNKQVASYDMPADVVSRDNNFMNDIVLDYVDGQVRYAYITDVLEEVIHVFDFLTGAAWNVKDADSMKAEANGEDFINNGVNYTFTVGVDGIAMSPDFDYVYYCPLAGYKLYQVPTSSLRNGSAQGVRPVGKKVSQSGGVIYSDKSFYYGALADNAVYSWDAQKDARDQNVDIGHVKLTTEMLVAKNNQTMQWQDTFAVDECGWLWFVSNRLQLFITDTMDFSGREINMRIWKVFINETSYLQGARERTAILPIIG